MVRPGGPVGSEILVRADKVIDRTLASPEAGVLLYGGVDEALGAGDGLWKRQAKSEAGGDGGGVGAPGPVGVARVEAGGGEEVEIAVEEEHVGGAAFEVTAFDEYGAGTKVVDGAGGVVGVVEGFDPPAGEQLRLEDVRGDEGGARE